MLLKNHNLSPSDFYPVPIAAVFYIKNPKPLLVFKKPAKMGAKTTKEITAKMHGDSKMQGFKKGIKKSSAFGRPKSQQGLNTHE